MVDWIIADGLTDYRDSLNIMEQRIAAISAGNAEEAIWLVEHPPLYSAGTSAKADHLLEPHRFSTYQTGRGGQYTYHGPGQRVVYVMINLNKRKRDIRAFSRLLEQWIIKTLASFNLKAHTCDERIGVWVKRPEKPLLPDGRKAEDKIAAIGIRVRKWITFHGFAINVEPNLEHFSGIIPCGIKDYGVTSFVDLGLLVSMADVDLALMDSFKHIFGEDPCMKTL